MLIRSSLSTDQISTLVRRTSDDIYGGNVVVESISTERVSRNGITVRVKIGTLNSRAHGSRTSASGRHGRWASWHAFRDILIAVFDADPKAVVHTGIATYRGRDGFEATFPATAHRNVGSLYSPATFASLSV